MPLSKAHYVNLKNGQFDSTSRGEFASLFQTFAASPARDNLVVYFHGGLVGEGQGMATAERLLPVFQAAGSYPVFFVWESGLMDMTHNLGEIAREPIFKLLLRKVSQFAVGKIIQTEGTRGPQLELPLESEVDGELARLERGEMPFSDVDWTAVLADEVLQSTEQEQFESEFKRDTAIETEAQLIANSFRTSEDVKADLESRGTTVRGSSLTLMSPAIVEEVKQEIKQQAGADANEKARGLFTAGFLLKHAVSLLKRVVVRFAKRRAHGVYATIVEELLREFYVANVGELIWTHIKKDTADAFQPNPAIFGGTAFLEETKTMWQSGHKPRITLIGHSTGAVYICNLLKQAQQQRLPADVKFDVIFLAPACTCSLFAEALGEAGGRIDHFRMFTMSDENEKANRLLPVVYPHSLLYFVSGVVEKDADHPIVGMQRFYSGAPPFDPTSFPDVDVVRRYIATDQARAVWSVTDLGQGKASASKTHSDFAKDDVTLSSLKHIIHAGF